MYVIGTLLYLHGYDEKITQGNSTNRIISPFSKTLQYCELGAGPKG